MSFKLVTIFLFCGIYIYSTKAAVVFESSYHNGKEIRWAQNCDFEGHDDKNVAVLPQHCGPRCVEDSFCTHFAWFNGICYLKHAAALWQIGNSAKEKANTLCGRVVERLN